MPVCPECPGRSFTDANALRMHRESKHPSRYSCGRCNKAFNSQQALEQHARDKHSFFECRYCDREFTTENGRDTHEDAKHPTFECHYCDCEFNSEDARQQHEDVKHATFECRYCDREFSSEEAREEHEDAKHTTFGCRHCDREFSSDAAREQHESAKHSGFQCRYCSSRFPSEYARRLHERNMHDFECDICRKSFTQMEVLWQHQRTSHFECSYCDSDHSTAALKKAHETSCPCNPANRIVPPKSTKIVEKEPSPSVASQLTDEESESSTSPSRSSQDEGEMFHSTSIPPSAGANGGEVTNTQASACAHSPNPDKCSTCHPSSTRKIVPDDAGSVVCAGENHKDDSKDRRDVIFQCTPCFKLFETEEAFRDHICAFRMTMPRPHCPICYTQFDDGQLLQSHLEGLQAFSCRLCLTRCCSDEMLQDHMLSHPTCGKCDKSFADNLALCAHLESDHPVVVCWDCDGIVVEKNSLELHYADSPAHPSCALCSVGMRNTADINEHIRRVHAGTAEMIDQPGGGDASLDEESSLPQTQPPAADQPEDAARQPSEEPDPAPLSSSVDSGGPLDGPGDQPLNAPLATESSLYSSPQPPVPPEDEAAVDGDEIPDAVRQYASPSPTPSEHGSDTSRLHLHASKATIGSTNNDNQSPSSTSSVSTGSLSDLSTRSTPTSSASNSVVFVSADGIPEYVRENRAVLVATSAGSPSSGRTPLRLSSSSSLAAASVEAVGTGRAYRLHCRICLRDPCEDVTATICGHLFCKRCITQAVVAKSECPVCRTATLLYCLFKLDLTA